MAVQVTSTVEFDQWLAELRDRVSRRAINARIVRVQSGLFGDVEPVGSGVSELKIDVGAGYRVYFVTRNQTIIVLLCGGDKGSQKRDIRRAKGLVATL